MADEFDPFTKNDSIIGPLDPFIGSITQTHRMRAFVGVIVAGVDITHKIYPHLLSVRVRDEFPEATAEIEIDDRDGKMPLPPLDATVSIALGWQSESMVNVFNGVVKDFEHGFARKQGGRRMWVHCSGISDVQTRAKQPMQDHAGEGAPPGQTEGKMIGLPDFIQQVAKKAGINPAINNVLANVKQDYWHQANESFMHMISSLGEKHGFIPQFTDGTKLTIETKGERGLSCHAAWRDNLIAWRVHPVAMRAVFAGGTQQWFDHLTSQWNLNAQKFGLKGVFNAGDSNQQPQAPAATESGASNELGGMQTQAETQEGNGRIIINGEPNAKHNSYVILTGARPGVDGLYWIAAAEHNYSRHGFITTLEVQTEANAPDNQNVGRAFEGFDLPRPQPNF